VNDRDRIQGFISDLVKEELTEVSPVFYPTIKKGIEAGREASRRQASAYRGRHGQTFSDELAQIRRDSKRKRDRHHKMLSLSKHLKKVFGNNAYGGSALATVEISNDFKADVKAEFVSVMGIDNVKFVVSIKKNGKEILTKEFVAGLGAKQSVARFIKKFQEKLQEDAAMKVTKAQLKEMVRKIIRKKLTEMDLGEKSRSTTGADRRMSPSQLEKHLEKERERSKQAKVVKKRQAMKQSARGMELESRIDIDRDVDNEEMVDAKEEEYLTKLEKLILQSEKEGLC